LFLYKFILQQPSKFEMKLLWLAYCHH